MTLLRSTIRRLRRNPGFAITTISILSLAIAANVVMFAVLNAILLRPLPFPQSDRLISIAESRHGAVGDGLVSLPAYDAWSKRQTAVDVGAYMQIDGVLAGAEPRQLNLAAVSSSLFNVLGVHPSVGSQITPDDDQPQASRTLVLSASLWRDRFGSDPRAIGSNVTIDGQPYRILGVAPPGFDFPKGTDAWTALRPLVPAGYERVTSYKFLNVIGRLRGDETVTRASNVLSAITSALPQNSGWRADVHTMLDVATRAVRLPLLLLMSAVTLVLLIACANVGNLMMARGAGRARELAVRAALGGSRVRLAFESIVESSIIAVVSCLIGLAVAVLALPEFLKLAPLDLPRLDQVSVDHRVWLFAILVVLLSTMASGLMPAIRLLPADLAGALRDGARTDAVGSHGRLRTFVVGFEIALSVVLLVVGGLLTRSFISLVAVNPGYVTSHVVGIQIKPPSSRYKWPLWNTLFAEITERLNAIRGVRSVSTATALPLSGDVPAAPIVIEGREATPTNASALVTAVSPAYFATLGIPIDSGRAFAERDAESKVGLAIVSEAFVRRFFPHERNVIGRRIRPFFGGPTFREIIGIAHDSRQDDLAKAPEPVVYDLAAQQGSGPLFVIVRSDLTAPQLVRAVRTIVRDIDPRLPLGAVTTLDDLVDRSLSKPRTYSVILTTFALIALLLVAAGIYALLSELLAQRRQEFAIRMALGANSYHVVAIFAREGMRLTIAGVIMGLLLSVPAARTASSLLYGVRVYDPLTFAVTVTVVFGIAAMAVGTNARRAARVDPVLSLR